MDGRILELYFDRARSFDLTEREVAEVAEHLRSTTNDRARFKCIMILRRQGSRAHVPLVAPLVHSADTGVADEAMRFLLRDADRADLCRDTLLEWLVDEGDFSFKPLDAARLVEAQLIQDGNFPIAAAVFAEAEAAADAITVSLPVEDLSAAGFAPWANEPRDPDRP